MTARAARRALAAAGVVAACLLAEGAARLHGDVVCVETPGAVYERDGRFGWKLRPGFAGWVRGCAAPGFAAAPADVNAHGLLDPERPLARPPDRRRILLLGGLAEGLGVREPSTLARQLEQRADRRRGARLEVVNAAIGGFALDNDLQLYRHLGRRFEPSLVLVVVDPVREIAALSPTLGARDGAAPPGKAYFKLIGEVLAPAVYPRWPPVAPPAAPRGWERSALLRLALGAAPPPAAPPLPLAADEVAVVPVGGTPAAERTRAETVAAAIVAQLAREVANDGARLALAVAPPPPGTDGATDAERLLAIARARNVPAVDLAPAFDAFAAATGRSPWLADGRRWSADGHFVAGERLWRFVHDAGLIPPGVVPARVLGGGKVPELATFREALAETAWRGRHALFPRFVVLGLLCVALVWAGAALPAAARDWWLVAVSVGLVAALGTPWLAAATLAYAVVFHVAVDRLPRPWADVAAALLLVALVVVPVVGLPGRIPGYVHEAREYYAFALNVALLRFAAYAVDRLRRGTPARTLREYLGAMLFFPTFVNGPIETTEDFAAGRPAGGIAPDGGGALARHARRTVGALGRLLLGVAKVYVALVLLNKMNADVFATQGASTGVVRLWLWAAELYVYFYVVFAGWTDVAIALGAMVGARVRENFDRPWAATNVADFWNRWHASFGRWLRTYVYIPLGGNRRHRALNVLVVFLVSGLWHVWGALKLMGPAAYPPPAWTGFVVWGILNAAAVVAVHRLAGARLAAVPRLVRQAVTFAVLSVFWIPFFMPPWNRIDDAVGIFARLFLLR